MRKFPKNFYEQISLESNKERKALEKGAKDIELDIQNLAGNNEYLTCKNKLEAIYDDTADGIKSDVVATSLNKAKNLQTFFFKS